MLNITARMCSHPKSIAKVLQSTNDRLEDLEAVQTKPFKDARIQKNKQQADREAKAEARRKAEEARAAEEAEEARVRAKAEAEEDALLAAETQKQKSIDRARKRAGNDPVRTA